jgi:hypothetical protein
VRPWAATSQPVSHAYFILKYHKIFINIEKKNN